MLAAQLGAVSGLVPIKLYPQPGRQSFISWRWVSEVKPGLGHRATREAEKQLKVCPKPHDDKKAGPKKVRVHSRRDGSLGHGHTPQVSFPTSVGYFSTRPRGSWVRRGAVRLWSGQGPRGAQGTYAQGFSRAALAGCPSMGPPGYRWDAGAC